MSAIAKRMAFILCAALPLLAAGGAIYYRSWACLPWICGAALGIAANLGKVILLDFTVKRSVAMDKSKGMNFVRLMHLGRLVLVGAALVAAAFIVRAGVSPSLLWGTAAAVLLFQPAALSTKFFSKER